MRKILYWKRKIAALVTVMTMLLGGSAPAMAAEDGEWK